MANFIDKIKQFPKAAPYIVVTEMAERFSFYGMRGILASFLVTQFYNPTGLASLQAAAESQSNEMTHFFNAMVYLLSIVGGALADYVLGRYRTIILLSIIYCIGHAFLAIFESNYELFYIGLMLIAVGAGGVKPNVSVMVGDQFESENDGNISKLYDIFYFGINLGALFSLLLTPYLKRNFGPSVAFGVPGILMFLALLTFLAGTKKYKIVKPSDVKFEEGESIWTQLKDAWQVLVVLCFIPVFWALYDQNSSEWVLQASHKNYDLNFLGITWYSDQIQAVNALMILIMIPIFTFGIYPAIEKMGVRVTALKKFGIGLLMTALTFALMAWIQGQLDSGIKMSIMWQLFAYSLLTISEILVSITGLEYSFSCAPKTLKSTIMALFFFTVFLGNMIDVFIHQNIQSGGFLKNYMGESFYWLFVKIMLVNAGLFYLITWALKIKDTNSTAEISANL